jgi:hypothetical protein
VSRKRWVTTRFFGYPLDENQLQLLPRQCMPAEHESHLYLFTALFPRENRSVMSSRLSRVLVSPDGRQVGIGAVSWGLVFVRYTSR